MRILINYSLHLIHPVIPSQFCFDFCFIGATPAQSRINLLAWLDNLIIGSGRQQAARLLYQDCSASTIYHHLSGDVFLDFVANVATGTINQWSGECKASRVSAGAMVAMHNQKSILHGRHLSFGPFVSHTT